MKKYSDLKEQYNILDKKYNDLFGEHLELQYELSELKDRADNICEQDEKIRSLHESIRKIKHDMKNHLMVIASYINSGEQDKANTYISGILDKLNAVNSYIETGNSLLNHILNEKLNYARNNGISVKAEIDNLSFRQMESLDFSALLSNILDNAIEASMGKNNAEISVVISRKRAYETISVKNKIESSVIADNPRLSSTKSGGDHGIGISQIKEIVQKYNGVCDFYEENGYFCVCAFIPE